MIPGLDNLLAARGARFDALHSTTTTGGKKTPDPTDPSTVFPPPLSPLIQINNSSLYSLNTSPSTSPPLNYRGLHNEGTTCYLNSLIQSLFVTSPLRTAILTYDHIGQIHFNLTESQLQALFVKSQLEITAGLSQWHREKAAEKSANSHKIRENSVATDEEPYDDGLPKLPETPLLSSLSPSLTIIYKYLVSSPHLFIQFKLLLLSLLSLYNGAVSSTPLLRSFGWTSEEFYEQKDVNEMMMMMTMKMEQDGERDEKYWREKKGGEVEAKEKAGSIRSAALFSFLYGNEGFKGMLLDSLQCRKCNSMRLKYEGFSSLSLNIKETLKKCIDLYVEKEDSGGNRVRCSMCGDKQDSYKGIDIIDTGGILVMNLKRFQMNWEREEKEKVMKDVDIPKMLYMKEWVEKGKQVELMGKQGDSTANSSVSDCIYDLYSILIHTGSATSGHYFSLLRPSFGSALWLKADDERIQRISLKEMDSVLSPSDDESKRQLWEKSLELKEKQDEEEKQKAMESSITAPIVSPSNAPIAPSFTSPTSPTAPVAPPLSPSTFSTMAPSFTDPKKNAYMLFYRKRPISSSTASGLPSDNPYAAEIDNESALLSSLSPESSFNSLPTLSPSTPLLINHLLLSFIYEENYRYLRASKLRKQREEEVELTIWWRDRQGVVEKREGVIIYPKKRYNLIKMKDFIISLLSKEGQGKESSPFNGQSPFSTGPLHVRLRDFNSYKQHPTQYLDKIFSLDMQLGDVAWGREKSIWIEWKEEATKHEDIVWAEWAGEPETQEGGTMGSGKPPPTVSPPIDLLIEEFNPSKDEFYDEKESRGWQLTIPVSDSLLQLYTKVIDHYMATGTNTNKRIYVFLFSGSLSIELSPTDDEKEFYSQSVKEMLIVKGDKIYVEVEADGQNGGKMIPYIERKVNMIQIVGFPYEDHKGNKGKVTKDSEVSFTFPIDCRSSLSQVYEQIQQQQQREGKGPSGEIRLFWSKPVPIASSGDKKETQDSHHDSNGVNEDEEEVEELKGQSRTLQSYGLENKREDQQEAELRALLCNNGNGQDSKDNASSRRIRKAGEFWLYWKAGKPLRETEYNMNIMIYNREEAIKVFNNKWYNNTADNDSEDPLHRIYTHGPTTVLDETWAPPRVKDAIITAYNQHFSTVPPLTRGRFDIRDQYTSSSTTTLGLYVLGKKYKGNKTLKQNYTGVLRDGKPLIIHIYDDKDSKRGEQDIYGILNVFVWNPVDIRLSFPIELPVGDKTTTIGMFKAAIVQQLNTLTNDTSEAKGQEWDGGHIDMDKFNPLKLKEIYTITHNKEKEKDKETLSLRAFHVVEFGSSNDNNIITNKPLNVLDGDFIIIKDKRWGLSDQQPDGSNGNSNHNRVTNSLKEANRTKEKAVKVWSFEEMAEREKEKEREKEREQKGMETTK